MNLSVAVAAVLAASLFTPAPLALPASDETVTVTAVSVSCYTASNPQWVVWRIGVPDTGRRHFIDSYAMTPADPDFAGWGREDALVPDGPTGGAYGTQTLSVDATYASLKVRIRVENVPFADFYVEGEQRTALRGPCPSASPVYLPPAPTFTWMPAPSGPIDLGGSGGGSGTAHGPQATSTKTGTVATSPVPELSGLTVSPSPTFVAEPPVAIDYRDDSGRIVLGLATAAVVGAIAVVLGLRRRRAAVDDSPPSQQPHP